MTKFIGFTCICGFYSSQVVGTELGNGLLLSWAMLWVTFLSLVGLQGGLQVAVDALACLLCISSKPTVGFREERLKVCRYYVDFPTAFKCDAEGVAAVGLQFREQAGEGGDGLFPTILQLPTEGLLLHHFQLHHQGDYWVELDRKPVIVKELVAVT